MKETITVISDGDTHFTAGGGVFVVIRGTIHVADGARAVVVGSKSAAHIVGRGSVSAYDGARVFMHVPEALADIHDTSVLIAHAGTGYLYNDARAEVPRNAAGEPQADHPSLHMFGMSTSSIDAPAVVFLHDLAAVTVNSEIADVRLVRRSPAASVEVLAGADDASAAGEDGSRPSHAAAEPAPNIAPPPFVVAPPSPQAESRPMQQQDGAQWPSDIPPLPAVVVPDQVAGTFAAEPAPSEAGSPYGDPTEWGPSEWIGITDPSGPVIRYDSMESVVSEALDEFEPVSAGMPGGGGARGQGPSAGIAEELPDLSQIPSAQFTPPGMGGAGTR